MKTSLKLFLLFWLATVLHWGCMAALGRWGIGVNVMLVFAVAVCTYLKPQYGYPAAFVCGLFLDFFGVKLFGHHALTFTLCAMAVYSLEKRLDFDSPVPQVLAVVSLCLFSVLVNLFLLRVFAGVSAWGGFWAFVGALLLEAAWAPLVFWGVRRTFATELKAS